MTGQEIKKIREELGLSQKEFAKKFHFTDQAHLSKVERNVIPISDLRAAYMRLWAKNHTKADNG